MTSTYLQAVSTTAQVQAVLTTATNTTQAVTSPISSTQAVATQASPSVTSQNVVERFNEETMPPLRYPDCSECSLDFVSPCLSNPCYACGQWFHPACYTDHYCSLSASDSDDESEQEPEH